jgi:hypothetical protein
MEGCKTVAAHVVGTVWHPDVALCNAADGTDGETERVFQACIRLCGGIFLGCLVQDRRTVFCCPCSSSVAGRVSFGLYVHDCARFPHLALQNMRWA